jgi:ribosomal protein L2
MFINKKPSDFIVPFSLKKRRVTSGASRKVFFLKSSFPIQLPHKKLSYIPKSLGGRNCSGKIVVRTKGCRSRKLRKVRFNRSFRQLHLCFVAGFFTLPFVNKLASLIFLGCGSATFVQSTTGHEILKTTRLKSVFYRRSAKQFQLSYLKDFLTVPTSFFLIKNLPKNQPISLIEVLPEEGIKYSRGVGTKSVMLRLDTRTSASLIKLPSGVKKVFSIYSVGSKGCVALPENKKCSNNSAG